MQTDMTKEANKTAKRRNRNKRRKQQRQQKQKSEKIKNHIGQTGTTSKSVKPNLLEHCQQQETHKSHSRGLQLWRKTYEAAVRWHCNHQMNYWRQRCEQLQLENETLKRKQPEMQNRADTVYETSSDDETETEEDKDDEEQADEDGEYDEQATDDVDAEYIEFLAVTQKHREELRLAREQGEC